MMEETLFSPRLPVVLRLSVTSLFALLVTFATFVSFASFASFAADRTPAAEVVASAPAGKTPAVSGPLEGEDLQTCLERLRKNDFDKQQRLAPLPKSGETKESPYSFSKVEPTELPNSCPEGDLGTIKQALSNQLANCQMAPEKRAGEAIIKLCKTSPVPSWCADKKLRKSKIREQRMFLGKTYNLEKTFKMGCRSVTRQEWCSLTNEKMLKLANESKDFASFMRAAHDRFDWFKSNGKLEDDVDGKFKKGDMQFTAYDTPPPIEASLKPTDQFKYPIYRRPPNLIKMTDAPESASCGNDSLTGVKLQWCLKNADGSFAPVPTRKDIEKFHALKNDSLIVAYVKNPVDLAFLMVEGSGSISVTTPEGQKILRANYDGQNGRARYMMSRIIKCDGGTHDDYSSENGIRNYLKARGERVESLLNFDQSYVFLRPEDKGPFGADGVVISGRHSFAVDPTVVPLGTVTLFNLRRGQKPNCDSMTSMAIAQDTGGAIIGAHVDWYTGDGAEAQALAGDMNAAGSLFAALPPGAGRPIKGCK